LRRVPQQALLTGRLLQGLDSTFFLDDTLKPSVAKKLDERIRELEHQLQEALEGTAAAERELKLQVCCRFRSRAPLRNTSLLHLVAAGCGLVLHEVV
jgi:hypothetical protein